MRSCKPYHKIPLFYCLTGEGNAWLDMVNVTQPASLICAPTPTYWEQNGLKWQPWKEHFVQLFRHLEPSKITSCFGFLSQGRLVINVTKIFKFYSSSHNWTFLTGKDDCPCLLDLEISCSSFQPGIPVSLAHYLSSSKAVFKLSVLPWCAVCYFTLG